MKETIESFRNLLQMAIKQKSIKIFADGRILIIYRYKPDELKTSAIHIEQLQEKLIKKLKAITNINYTITKLQKEPSLCYNTYVRLISTSSAASQDKLKSFLKYFRKDENNNFIKTSYKEVTVNLSPSSKEDFINFILSQR